MSESECSLNIRAQLLERAGRVTEAIDLYEDMIARGTIGPHPYNRLLAIYWKTKRQDDERRICELAAVRFPETADGYGRRAPSHFVTRLRRLRSRAR